MHAEVVTGVAVVVNNEVITKGEIESTVEVGRQNAYNAYRNDPKAYVDAAIEGLVERKLIMHDFVTSGYLTNLLEAYVDNQIRDYIRDHDYGDRARFIRTLHAEGQTYEAFRLKQREDLIVFMMTRQNSSDLRKILISPLKVEEYYRSHPDEFKIDDQVKLRMIALPTLPNGTPDATKKMGEEILSKIDSGVPFAEMAEIYSAASERAVGGDCGWHERHFYTPAIDQIAFALKPGEHSGVIELPGKCYLLMVDEVEPAHTKTLTEVRNYIEQKLMAEESNRLRKLWIERLKRKSWVSYY
jgi:parvulin-like peptidyl-prolyl isomerase